jgi:hypothetical protein
MNLIIKFPTRGRADKFLNVLNRYIEFMDDKSTKIIVSCDNDDETMKQGYVMDELSSMENVTVVFGDSKTKIEACNADMEDVDFDIVLLASDDMVPQVRGYDTIIKEAMEDYFPDTDGVLWFNDGYQSRAMNTLCILGKKYYDRFSYIYHPDYISLWCDNEFTVVANMLGRQKYFEQVIIQHQHPAAGFGENDNLYNENDKYNNADMSTFMRRQQNRFGL